MPTELVLLADLEATTEILAACQARRDPDGLVVASDDGGFRMVVDAVGRPVATFFRPQRIGVRQAAREAMTGDVDERRLWCDVTLPYGGATEGRQLVDEVARRIGGVVLERS